MRPALFILIISSAGMLGCQCGLSRPGMEFRVYRPAVALEPRLVDSHSASLSAIPLEPEGVREFRRRPPPSTFSFPAPDVEEFSLPMPQARLSYPQRVPMMPLNPCVLEQLLQRLDRLERKAGVQSQGAAPMPRPCPEE